MVEPIPEEPTSGLTIKLENLSRSNSRHIPVIDVDQQAADLIKVHLEHYG